MKEFRIEIRLFLDLIRTGLWEKMETHDSWYMSRTDSSIDWLKIYKMAEEQGVLGLLVAGLEYISMIKPPQEDLLTIIGRALQFEQRNKSMNNFISTVVGEMRAKGINALLVKGQGLAQCYERPLWRACGDIDFFFSDSDYIKAIKFFIKKGASEFQNARYTKSYGVMVEPWMVELHGTLRSGLSSRVDREIDAVQNEVFYNGDVRTWHNGEVDVLIPGINSDLFLLFTHFIRHFYQNEFVLRQLCDWCRFLWTYKEKIDVDLLKKRLNKTHLVPEWKAFASIAVEWLGMPVDAMPLYDNSECWKKKAEEIISYSMSGRKPSKLRDIATVAAIFPANIFRFLPSLLLNVNWLKIKERLLKE